LSSTRLVTTNQQSLNICSVNVFVDCIVIYTCQSVKGVSLKVKISSSRIISFLKGKQCVLFTYMVLSWDCYKRKTQLRNVNWKLTVLFWRILMPSCPLWRATRHQSENFPAFAEEQKSQNRKRLSSGWPTWLTNVRVTNGGCSLVSHAFL